MIFKGNHLIFYNCDTDNITYEMADKISRDHISFNQ